MTTECDFPHCYMPHMFCCVEFSHTSCQFSGLAAKPASPASLYSVKQSASRRKGLWAGKHVSSPTTWLSHIEHKSKGGGWRGRENAGLPSQISYTCAWTYTKAKANAVSISSSLRPFLPYSAVNTYCINTPSTRPPFAALQAQLPKAAGDGQCLLLHKFPIVSCSTNTTSPPFLCLLIPGIRRHGWVMTEMISLSASPSITPRQLLHHLISIHAWTGAVSWAASPVKSLSHFYLAQILSSRVFLLFQSARFDWRLVKLLSD